MILLLILFFSSQNWEKNSFKIIDDATEIIQIDQSQTLRKLLFKEYILLPSQTYAIRYIQQKAF